MILWLEKYQIRFCDISNGLTMISYSLFLFIGFIGLHCEKPCAIGYYGYNCTQECDCLNDGYCNPRNGECLCRPGYEGPKCENQCKVNLYQDLMCHIYPVNVFVIFYLKSVTSGWDLLFWCSYCLHAFMSNNSTFFYWLVSKRTLLGWKLFAPILKNKTNWNFFLPNLQINFM